MSWLLKNMMINKIMVKVHMNNQFYLICGNANMKRVTEFEQVKSKQRHLDLIISSNSF
jgi:hypothetical protein